MKHIEEYVLNISNELCDAKEYAEKALYWKYEGNPTRYKTYYDLASDEIKHANNIHALAIEDIGKLKSQGYVAPEVMQEEWDKSHREYVEKTAWIKQMLAM